MEGAKIKKLILFMCVFLLFFVTSAYAIEYDLIVVRSDIPTDYVIASTYANSKRIPVILVKPDEISKDIEKTLRGYVINNYKNLLIIGGEEAILPDVENYLVGMGFSVNRLWDWDRYGTAGRVAIDLWIKSDNAVLVDGENYQNLLIAHRYALKSNLPVLFTKNSTLPPETETALRRLEVKKIYCFDHEFGGKLEGIDIEVMDVKNIEFEEEPKGENKFWFAISILSTCILLIIILIFFIKRGVKIIPSTFLTKEERMIFDLIETRGSINQNQLPEITGFSKPKISRILQGLESRGIVTRKKVKKTYNIELKSKIDNI